MNCSVNWSISLSDGPTVVVSGEDVRYLIQSVWYSTIRNGLNYPRRSTQRIDGRNGSQYMHHVVLAFIPERERGLVVDHRNHNTLDNRRSNLRVATHSQNHANSKLSKRNKSGFKGVRWRADKSKWQAMITHRYKVSQLGYFSTIEEAHLAYCEAATNIHGEFACFG
jgi:hypothetical protein